VTSQKKKKVSQKTTFFIHDDHLGKFRSNLDECDNWDIDELIGKFRLKASDNIKKYYNYNYYPLVYNDRCGMDETLFVYIN
jgi:hypothetical protein